MGLSRLKMNALWDSCGYESNCDVKNKGYVQDIITSVAKN